MQQKTSNFLLLVAAVVILSLSFTLIIAAVNKDAEKKPKREFTTIDLSFGTSIEYTVVVIDGNEYLACRSYGMHYILCPKLPPKTKCEPPAEPEHSGS